MYQTRSLKKNLRCDSSYFLCFFVCLLLSLCEFLLRALSFAKQDAWSHMEIKNIFLAESFVVRVFLLCSFTKSSFVVPMFHWQFFCELFLSKFYHWAALLRLKIAVWSVHLKSHNRTWNSGVVVVRTSFLSVREERPLGCFHVHTPSTRRPHATEHARNCRLLNKVLLKEAAAQGVNSSSSVPLLIRKVTLA